MLEKTYYIANTEALDIAIDVISNAITCGTIERECEEMNYSKVTVKTTPHNISCVEKVLVPLV